MAKLSCEKTTGIHAIDSRLNGGERLSRVDRTFEGMPGGWLIELLD